MKTFLFGMLALPLTLIAAGTVKAAGNLEKATFAGGCFWCMEHPFDALPGVVSVTSGYTGGQKKNPTYKEVSAGGTGHAEAVQIVYDPSKISYGKLLDVYWHNIDPTTKDRQFCDVGNQYRAAIFYHTEEQHRAALQSKEALEKPSPSRSRWSPGSFPPVNSIRRRSITSTTTRRTRSVTIITGTDAAATGGSRNYGGTRPEKRSSGGTAGARSPGFIRRSRRKASSRKPTRKGSLRRTPRPDSPRSPSSGNSSRTLRTPCRRRGRGSGPSSPPRRRPREDTPPRTSRTRCRRHRRVARWQTPSIYRNPSITIPPSPDINGETLPRPRGGRPAPSGPPGRARPGASPSPRPTGR